MKILITGKNGQVGWELHQCLARLGNVIALGRSEMDLTSANSIRNGVREVRPDVIVNAAAYTAVDKAESEPELAMVVNGTAPGILAEEARRCNALLIHYSTDYIFDGTKTSPYSENDEPKPLNIYGATKLAGERAIQAVGAAHLIFRTSWVYGLRGSNFLLTILRLAEERDELRVVDDQIGAPTWSRPIAQASARILNSLLAGNLIQDWTCKDVFHLTASNSISWCGFANEIIAQTKSARLQSPKIIPIASEDYNSAAKRPKNSVLSGDKVQHAFGFTLGPWKEHLTTALTEHQRPAMPDQRC